MQLVDGKWSRELNTEFKFQLLANENEFLVAVMDWCEICELLEWEKIDCNKHSCVSECQRNYLGHPRLRARKHKLCIPHKVSESC